MSIPEYSIQSELVSTTFPKISGKRYDFLKALKRVAKDERLPRNSTLDLEGSVKLHGIHADLVFPLAVGDTGKNDKYEFEASEDVNIIFQTRNQRINPSESVFDYPQKLAAHTDILIRLKSRILSRFTTAYRNEPLNSAYPLIVAGEWIGHRVQRYVGISRLSTRFIITAISINGQWQDDMKFGDIEEPEAHIYNVLARVPQYHVKFWLGDLTETNEAFQEMQKLADDIERKCPFAAAFGVTDSQGEGIVWKIGTKAGRSRANNWIKTKGPISMGKIRQPNSGMDHLLNERKENVQRPSQLQTNNIPYRHESKALPNPNLNAMDVIAMHYITPRRIEQGFEYLIETNIYPRDVSAQAVFTQWIIDDIVQEENAEIVDLCKKNKSQYNCKKMVGFNYNVRLLETLKSVASKKFSDEIARDGDQHCRAFERGRGTNTREESILNAEASDDEVGTEDAENPPNLSSCDLVAFKPAQIFKEHQRYHDAAQLDKQAVARQKWVAAVRAEDVIRDEMKVKLKATDETGSSL